MRRRLINVLPNSQSACRSQHSQHRPAERCRECTTALQQTAISGSEHSGFALACNHDPRHQTCQHLEDKMGRSSMARPISASSQSHDAADSPIISADQRIRAGGDSLAPAHAVEVVLEPNYNSLVLGQNATEFAGTTNDGRCRCVESTESTLICFWFLTAICPPYECTSGWRGCSQCCSCSYHKLGVGSICLHASLPVMSGAK